MEPGDAGVPEGRPEPTQRPQTGPVCCACGELSDDIETESAVKVAVQFYFRDISPFIKLDSLCILIDHNTEYNL